MAGRGPAPKDPAKRVRRNKPEAAQTILRFEPCEQPELRPLPDEDWCQATLDWWAMWRDAPQAEHMCSTDWDFLMDTAIIHHAVWKYMQLEKLPELRIRVAKLGATLEDRARLRMQFAEADEADSHRPSAARSARERYGSVSPLRAVGD